MSGILSYYKKEGLSKDDIVEAIHSLGSINHRGPDGEGVCLINTKTSWYAVKHKWIYESPFLFLITICVTFSETSIISTIEPFATIKVIISKINYFI